MVVLVHTKTGPYYAAESLVDSGLLSRGCGEQYLPPQSFLGQSGKMAEPSQLRFPCLEKWLDIRALRISQLRNLSWSVTL